jgi:sn-glycerol 3-phosphate transport system permease protein
MMLDRVRIGSHEVLIGVCALTILPFWWMLSTSFKEANAVFDLNPLPVAPTLQNYAQMWVAIPMGSMLLNTFFNAGLLMAGQVVVATLAAYAFARWRFRGDNLLLVLFVGTWLVPFQVTCFQITSCCRGWAGWIAWLRWWYRTSGAHSQSLCCDSS